MLKANSHFNVNVLSRTPSGGHFCHIFLAKGKSLAFKFNEHSKEVIIDKFNTKSKKSFQFELLPAEEFPKVNFTENCWSSN